MSSLVDQVPVVVERVKREIVLARFIGKLAVDQGLRELRQRLDPPPSGPTPTAAPTPAREPAAAPTPAVPSGPSPADLALADYDHLPASDVVAMLDGLEPAERDAIEAYERVGRRRRTILGKLAQLSDQR